MGRGARVAGPGGVRSRRGRRDARRDDRRRRLRHSARAARRARGAHALGVRRCSSPTTSTGATRRRCASSSTCSTGSPRCPSASSPPPVPTSRRTGSCSTRSAPVPGRARWARRRCARRRSRSLVREAGTFRATDAVCAACARATAGNPFYLRRVAERARGPRRDTVRRPSRGPRPARCSAPSRGGWPPAAKRPRVFPAPSRCSETAFRSSMPPRSQTSPPTRRSQPPTHSRARTCSPPASRWSSSTPRARGRPHRNRSRAARRRPPPGRGPARRRARRRGHPPAAHGPGGRVLGCGAPRRPRATGRWTRVARRGRATARTALEEPPPEETRSTSLSTSGAPGRVGSPDAVGT